MYRDALIFDLQNNKYLISTCDSCGSIGQKINDVLKIPTDIVGHLTAKVAIMEALSLNAMPIQIILSISNESEPTATEIILGVKQAVSELLSIYNNTSIPTVDDFPILISTETNMKTSMTALGIVVNAISDCPKTELPVVGDNVYMVGIPCVGNEVINNNDKILNIQTIKELISQNQIKQIIPAGSSGIKAELSAISKHMSDKNIKFDLIEKYKNIISKSAGPATSAVVFAPFIDKSKINIPIQKIANITLI